ncbi:MAG: type II secretion system GspH family protein [Planctomycetes bacterium]|nr:type II secretion system GspH family protein [Planctomycetota bacterium]
MAVNATSKNKRGFTLTELMIVVAVIAIIGAISIPNLLRSRISANEASAISQLKAISAAQVTFQVGRMGQNPVNTNTGMVGFCDNFRNLFYGNPASGQVETLGLIPRYLADAFARDVGAGCAATHTSPNTPLSTPASLNGYLFAEPKELLTNNGFASDFAILGVPNVSRKTGEFAFWLGQKGNVQVHGLEPNISYTVSVECDTPSSPTPPSISWTGL